jgi:hypothetical protein
MSTEPSLGSACHHPPKAPGQLSVPTPPRRIKSDGSAGLAYTLTHEELRTKVREITSQSYTFGSNGFAR